MKCSYCGSRITTLDENGKCKSCGAPLDDAQYEELFSRQGIKGNIYAQCNSTSCFPVMFNTTSTFRFNDR